MAPLTITVTYDNYGFVPGLKYGWGFSCLVQGAFGKVLFDTGSDGTSLIDNMRRLDIHPGEVDAVFLSHDHWDHVDGIGRFLAERARGVPIHITPSFSDDLRDRLRCDGCNVVEHGPVKEAVCEAEILPSVLSTGEMEGTPSEHSMVVMAAAGPVVVVGCCHQGLRNLLQRVRNMCGDDIALLVGGFHLFRDGVKELKDTVRMVMDMGVKKVAPTHCTGKRAIRIFEDAYGDAFIPMGVGVVIDC